MMKKRLISCLMVLALMCSFLPASVLADEVQEEPTVPVTEEVQPAAEEQGGALEEAPEDPQEGEKAAEEPETVTAVPAAQEGEGETPAVGETVPEGTVAEIARAGEAPRYFKTLGAAVAAAKTDDTIKLLADCEGTVQISMNSKKDTPTALTIDLNGCAIDGKGEKRCILGIQANSSTDRCALAVKNGTLRNGAAPEGSSGGAISWPCDLKIENCTIENSMDKAVAVSFVKEGGVVEVSSTNFTDNHETKASGSGGAVSIAGNGTAEFTKCTFADNSAANMGGALYCDHGELTITDCTFEKNSAAYGGAVACMTVNVTVKGDSAGMEGNTASVMGGAVHVQGNSALKTENAVFTGNEAAYGGAFSLYASEAAIDGTVQGNRASKLGGGCYNSGAVLDLTGADIYNNTAETAGDDVLSFGASSKLTVDRTGKWTLDDCKDRIDGWYEDGMPETVAGDDGKTSTVYGPRWDAHGAGSYVQAWPAGPAEGSLAIKAAHKVIVPLEPDDPSAPLEISKSKTTTNLDKSYESRVTLSLPSASYKPSMDVVMVIDVSSSMKDADIQEVKNAAEVLCSQLAEMQNLDVKVGVVTFDKNAHDLTGGLTTAAAAKNAVGQITVSSDTNMMAGLMMGKAMLDEGNGGDKYLVVMSDGIPIYWMEDGEAVSKTLERYTGDRLVSTAPAGSEPEGSWAYSDDKISPINDLLAMKDWETDSNIWRQEANTGADLNPDCKYNNIQKATYQTARYLRDEIFGRYNMKMVAFGTDKYKDNVVYQYGENFCDWIGEQTGVAYYKVAKPGYGGEIGDLSHAFADIADSLVYLVDAGSRIEDYMGYVEGSYDFDFVNDVDKLLVTVNGAALDKTKLDDNTYGFGRREAAVQAAIVDGNCKNYRFVLKYVPGEKGGEHFVFFINEAITKEYPVQLTYTVQLMNPKTASGTYGEFDADGSEKYDGLYTNNSATLYPVDSDGVKGLPESFAKPTVSYTVGGSSGGDGGGGKLNTEDHYSYIIGYKDGYLRPYGNISRGETATIFFRMLTDKTRTEYWSQTNPYTDVAAEKWCSNAISTLHRMGIIDGYSDGTFRPDGPITRAAFTKMAVNFFDYHVKAYDGKFSDVEDSAWYAGYIQAAAELKLIEGFDDGTFRPNDYITRAQACTIINRTLGRVPQGDHMNIKPLVTWPDCDADDWYYTAMMEATNSHDYKWITVNKEKTEEWTAKLPQRDWAALEHTWSTANSAKGGEVVG